MPEKSSGASPRRLRLPLVPDRPHPPGAKAGPRTHPARADRFAGRLALAAAADPFLREIVDRLLLGPASAAEVAADIGRDPQAVRHRLRRLARGGVVERGERSRRRGVSEFLYSCDPRATGLSSDRLRGLPALQVERAATRVIRKLFREALDASGSGSYFVRDDFIAIRFPLPLDAPGWRRAMLLHARLLDAIAAARGRAGARLARGTEPIEATAAVLLFETPSSPWPSPFSEGASSVLIRRRSRTDRVDAITAHADPLRLKIVDALNLGPVTAIELAAEIGAPLARVRYELRTLEKAGMAKVQSWRERRGAIENVFIADSPKMAFFAEDLPELAEKALRDWGSDFARLVFGDAVGGIRGGYFRDRADWRLDRMRLRLDPRGFTEVSAAMDATLEGLFELRDRCLARQADGAAAVRPAFFDLLLFEKPNPMLQVS